MCKVSLETSSAVYQGRKLTESSKTADQGISSTALHFYYGVSSKITPQPAPDCQGQERSPPIMAVPYRFPFGSSTTCAGHRPPDCPLKLNRTTSLPLAFNLYTTPQQAVPPKRAAP